MMTSQNETPACQQDVSIATQQPLSIAMLAVGTQGDIQPFVAVGLRLKDYGHRVRLATHEPHRSFVEQFGLEFYPLGGDPQILADFAVQSKGVFPRGLGQVSKLRQQIKAYVAGQLDACTQPDPQNPKAQFRADALIANPIGYAHIHVADALGIPLHILFTMPWTATREFAHPQARFLHEKQRSLSPRTQRWLSGLLGTINRASFKAIDGAMFVGTADILATFRKKILRQPSLFSLKHYHRPLHYCDVPVSYCWSPALLPCPADWPSTAEVVGFCQLEASQRMQYQPPEDLKRFLAAGSRPVYVGFGSMTLSKAKEVTETVLRAVQQAGVRAILLEGWGKLGTADGVAVPESVYVLRGRYAPHDWLFPQCAVVIHHGGAGTTGAGLAAGCPTMTVPFFGDQAFWGEMCRRAGVGPPPVAVENLTEQHLLEGLKMLLDPLVQEAAGRLAARMRQEPSGTQAAVDAFHRHLQGRLVSSSPCKQQRPLSVEATSKTSRPMNGSAPHPAAMNGCDSTGAPHDDSSQCSEPGKLSAPFRSADEHRQGTEQTRDSMAGQGALVAPESKASLEASRGGSSGGGLVSAISAKQTQRMKYFQKKPLPCLTGWWEFSAAFLAVFLLPLISIVPFSTTAERPDSHAWEP
ncbi:hypothetical protein CVIRNUC_009924 [Coccomyxa viridis]|uniref:Glycosyltransferase family 28 N-terminal domain-containing protein n=1 Tax=Coccomyxa viridis TaxID=1274662 RepID=A0AAV1IKZ1_9CHLO|nr:hypothetical protein CVIRNUC_009924 [Coccomyxa viridis]